MSPFARLVAGSCRIATGCHWCGRRIALTPPCTSFHHFRLVETVFETPAYRWVPWRAWPEFERDFNAARAQLHVALDAYEADYDSICETVLKTFRQLAAD